MTWVHWTYLCLINIANVSIINIDLVLLFNLRNICIMYESVLCMCVYMYVCIYVCLHVCIYVCIYVCMYVSMYVYMYECVVNISNFYGKCQVFMLVVVVVVVVMVVVGGNGAETSSSFLTFSSSSFCIFLLLLLLLFLLLLLLLQWAMQILSLSLSLSLSYLPSSSFWNTVNKHGSQVLFPFSFLTLFFTVPWYRSVFLMSSCFLPQTSPSQLISRIISGNKNNDLPSI